MSDSEPFHGAEGGNAMGEDIKTVKDPVCSMTIDPDQAVAHEDYQGHRYYFCAETCQIAFQQEPERYAKQAA